MNDTMSQTAPYPDELRDLVEHLEYRPGWTFKLIPLDRGQGSEGLTLDITTQGYNSYHHEFGQNYRVHHYMPVPPAAYNRQSWQHWLFQQLLLVEQHECCEFFTLVYKNGEEGFIKRDGTHEDEHRVKPYAPNHGPGFDPYMVTVVTTEEARRTSFRGEVKDAVQER
jgi:hypothetical protein